MKVYQDFFAYQRGVYKHSMLSIQHRTAYHSVRIVGWGEDRDSYPTKKYWVREQIITISWVGYILHIFFYLIPESGKQLGSRLGRRRILPNRPRCKWMWYWKFCISSVGAACHEWQWSGAIQTPWLNSELFIYITASDPTFYIIINNEKIIQPEVP